MKKSDYIIITILMAGTIAGCYISDFPGGYLSGSCSTLLIFVTLGKILYKKAAKRQDDNNDAIMKTWKNFLNEDQN